MTERHVCCVIAVALLFGCGVADRERASVGTDLDGLLPHLSSSEGWSVAEGPVTYLPNTLYEYLDGAAPRYSTYGFRKLIHVRYELDGDPLSSVTLNIFDMGSDLGAFGIYRSDMPPDIPQQAWGVEGYRSGTVAAAWKGSIYVHAEADDERPTLLDMAERLTVHATRMITVEASLPTVLEVFPTDGLVWQSERYMARDLLGHAFLPGGFVATYEVAGREARLFFSDLGSEQLALEAMAQLREHASRLGTVDRDSLSRGATGFEFSDPGLGPGIVATANRYVVGIFGDAQTAALERKLGQLIGSLDSAAGAH